MPVRSISTIIRTTSPVASWLCKVRETWRTDEGGKSDAHAVVTGAMAGSAYVSSVFPASWRPHHGGSDRSSCAVSRVHREGSRYQGTRMQAPAAVLSPLRLRSAVDNLDEDSVDLCGGRVCVSVQEAESVLVLLF